MRNALQEPVGSGGDRDLETDPGLHLEPSQLEGLLPGAGRQVA